MKISFYLTLLFLLTALFSHAQNMVGKSLKEIDVKMISLATGTLKRKVEVTPQGIYVVCYWEDDIDKSMRTYYFDKTPVNENSVCNKYTFTNIYAHLLTTIKSLNNSFDRQDEITWIEYGEYNYIWRLTYGDDYFGLTVHQIEKIETVK